MGTMILLSIITALVTIFSSRGGYEVTRAETFDDVPLKIDNSLRKYGLEILGSDHPSFETELQKYLAENSRHAAAINEAKRSGILVKNHADREVVGVSLPWTMSGPEARVVPQTQNHPGAL